MKGQRQRIQGVKSHRVNRFLKRKLHVQNILFQIAATDKMVLCRLCNFALVQILERIMYMVMEHIQIIEDQLILFDTAR